MIISIHQPDFFPWLGVFDKINRSDVFVYLDHVINNPRDPLWTKRVQMLVNGSPYWLTIPLERPKEKVFIPINEMKISRALKPEKQLRLIEQSYRKTSYFDEVFPLIEEFYEADENLIGTRNIKFIDKVCNKLEIQNRKAISSDFQFNSSSNELLIDIIKHFDANEYLHGKGALDYQNNSLFEKENIKLTYQDFRHPIYEQYKVTTFISGLSIIDPLMNIGWLGTKNLLNEK